MAKRNENTQRVYNRKKAYKYIVEGARQVNWVPPIDSDARLADVLDVPIGDITSLKKGLSDPSPKLVKEFKNLLTCIPAHIPEGQVDSYLVGPFSD